MLNGLAETSVPSGSSLLLFHTYQCVSRYSPLPVGMYLSHDNINNGIAWKYSIDKCDVDNMNNIYFYKKDNLPLRFQSKNEIINDSNNWGSLVPFQFWNFSLIPINSCPKKSLRDSIEKNNRCLTKSYIASSKKYSD